MEENKKDMTPRLIEDLGVLRRGNNKGAYRYGLYECQYCGNQWEVITRSVITTYTTNCGCLLIKKLITHGLKSNRFYNTWNHMVGRCNNPKNSSYKNYGGRGITVCEEWLDVRNFIAWAESTHPNTEGMSLDRIDNDKGYSPDNCRWTTREIQNTNQRVRSTNTSGFAGVSFEPLKSKWVAYICTNGINKKLGRFLTKEDAVQARDNYIIENELPHKLSGLIKN